MKKVVIGSLPIAFAALALCVSAQVPPTKPPPPVNPPATPAVAPCPQIQLQAPTQPMREGTPVNFVAVVNGGDPAVSPIFSWSISSGIVEKGQGTKTISVDTTGSGIDRQIIADLLVGGFAPECTNQATATVAIAGPAKKIDEFGDLAEKEESERLDVLIAALNQFPDRGYIIAYAGRNNVRGYASNALKRMKAYTGKAGIQSERVAAIDGGFREEPAYEVWVVPIGAEPPRSSPTVDRKDIVYPKTPPPVKKP